MSSMLEQAIIDAEQLKETAQRTAEEAVIEKYQSEIKEAVNAILEQEESLEEETEAAAVIDEEGTKIVDDLPSAQLAEDEDIVEINLDKLEELMAQEIEEGELSQEDMLDRAEVVQDLAEDLEEEIELDEDINDLLEEEDLDEEIEINEEDIAAVIAELLSEEEDELGPDLDEGMTSDHFGFSSAKLLLCKREDYLREKPKERRKRGRGREETEELEEKKSKDVDGDGDTDGADYRANQRMASGQSKEEAIKATRKLNKESKLLQKENKTLLREQKKMSNKVQLLENKVEKYGTVIEQLKEKLDESNLTNAKLLYQNRILNSISLNERQKDKIVEAISNATTVEEAKIIFETLQSAVGLKSKKTRKQESLNEVVTRSSSAFIPRKEVKPKTDVFSDRMKRLAGLK